MLKNERVCAGSRLYSTAAGLDLRKFEALIRETLVDKHDKLV
jgi:hypothetical protein